LDEILAKKLDNEKRGKRQHVREGKVVMHRSEKEIVKKPEVKIEIDQLEVDMRKYVGDLQRMVEM
jgi:hypothetical protein